jgi:hypothetical protein
LCRNADNHLAELERPGVGAHRLWVRCHMISIVAFRISFNSDPCVL